LSFPRADLSKSLLVLAIPPPLFRVTRGFLRLAGRSDSVIFFFSCSQPQFYRTVTFSRGFLTFAGRSLLSLASKGARRDRRPFHLIGSRHSLDTHHPERAYHYFWTSAGDVALFFFTPTASAGGFLLIDQLFTAVGMRSAHLLGRHRLFFFFFPRREVISGSVWLFTDFFLFLSFCCC